MKFQLTFVVVIFLATFMESYGATLNELLHGLNGHQKVRPECLAPKDAGDCEDFSTFFYYDIAEKKCKPFMFGGCNGNPNNFGTLERCEDFCGKTPKEVCQLPLDHGDCLASITSFYYNASEKKCVEFEYGGCEGNYNNFEIDEVCEHFCDNV